MDLDIHPAIPLSPGTFNILIAPEEMFILTLNHHLCLQHFRVLFISGNYSRVLSKLDRRFTDLDIRRSFTAYQLLTILEESHHTIIFIEHDPLLYEEAQDLPDYVSQAMKEVAKDAMVLLYAPALDRYLEEIAKRADRVFCFGNLEAEHSHGPRARTRSKAPRSERSQTTLGVF